MPFRTLSPGATLVEQGDMGRESYLLVEGVLTAEIDDRPLAEIGPGSLLQEERWIATLRAKTRCRVAITRPTRTDTTRTG